MGAAKYKVDFFSTKFFVVITIFVWTFAYGANCPPEDHSISINLPDPPISGPSSATKIPSCGRSIKNLPDSVDLQIKVITAGITLDDYTLERWLTNADYDETGEYRFRLFLPNYKGGSTCHTFKIYQRGTYIGEQ